MVIVIFWSRFSKSECMSQILFILLCYCLTATLLWWPRVSCSLRGKTKAFSFPSRYDYRVVYKFRITVQCNNAIIWWLFVVVTFLDVNVFMHVAIFRRCCNPCQSYTGTSSSDFSQAMNHQTSMTLREYNTLSSLYSAVPKTVGSSIFSPGQEYLWTCVDVNEEFIAIGTNVGLLFLYDRSKAVIRHQLSSQVDVIYSYFVIVFCLSVI